MTNPTPQSTVLLSGVQLQALKSVLQGRAEIEALTNKIVGELTTAYGHDPKTTQIDIRDLGTGLLHFEPLPEAGRDPELIDLATVNAVEAFEGDGDSDDNKIIDMVAPNKDSGTWKAGEWVDVDPETAFGDAGPPETPIIPGPEAN
jgi:hypothetical protein